MKKIDYLKGDYILTFSDGSTAEIFCKTSSQAEFLFENILRLYKINIKKVEYKNGDNFQF